MSDWKERIEAQIALMRDCGVAASTWADTMQALLDVAVAADDYMTYGPLNAEFGGDLAHNRLSHALDKLPEASDE